MNLNTKTGMIKLQVSPKKLGAVLSAIGAALDGHPWYPYSPVEVKARGCRGGRGKQEKKHLALVKSKQVVPATNPRVEPRVGGVPQLPTSSRIQFGTFSEGIEFSVGESSKTPTIAPVIAGVNLATTVIDGNKAAKGSSNPEASEREFTLVGAGRRSRSRSLLSTSTSSSLDDRGLPIVKGSGSRVIDITPDNLTSPYAGLTEIEELKARVVTVNRKSLPELKIAKFRERKPDVFHRFFMGIGNYTEVVETAAEYLSAKVNYLKRAKLIYVTQTAERRAFNNKYASLSHLSDCGHLCTCPATHDRRYMELLSKHRRCFAASRAEGSRDPDKSPHRKR